MLAEGNVLLAETAAMTTLTHATHVCCIPFEWDYDVLLYGSPRLATSISNEQARSLAPLVRTFKGCGGATRAGSWDEG